MQSFKLSQPSGKQHYALSCGNILSLHRAPTPEPDEDPLPGEHPVPQQDPVPSPFPELPVKMAVPAYSAR